MSGCSAEPFGKCYPPISFVSKEEHRCETCLHKAVCMHSADYKMIQMQLENLQVTIDGIPKKLSDIPWIDTSHMLTCKNYREDVIIR